MSMWQRQIHPRALSGTSVYSAAGCGSWISATSQPTATGWSTRGRVAASARGWVRQPERGRLRQPERAAASARTRRAERALAELDPDLLARAAPADVQRHRVAGGVPEQDLRQVALGADRLALHRGHDVAARAEVLVLEALVAVARLQMGALGGAVRGDVLDPRARPDRQVEVLGQLRVDRDARHAEVGVACAPVAAQLPQRALDRVDRPREADPAAITGLGLDLGVDAQHAPARVEQRP